MIRINLLQVRTRKDRKKSSGLLLVLVFLVLLLGEAGAAFYLQTTKTRQIDDRKAEVQQLQLNLNAERSKSADIEAKRAELDGILKKREVIQELQAARTGPKQMLFEMMLVLSRNGRPTMSDDTKRLLAASQAEGFNRAWDYRKLWVLKFEEIDREFTIEGSALDVEDISEFQRRLNLSQYFGDVRWVRSPEQQRQEDVAVYDFTLRGRVRYR